MNPLLLFNDTVCRVYLIIDHFNWIKNNDLISYSILSKIVLNETVFNKTNFNGIVFNSTDFDELFSFNIYFQENRTFFRKILSIQLKDIKNCYNFYLKYIFVEALV